MKRKLLAAAAAALIVSGAASLAQTVHEGHGTMASGEMPAASRAYMDAMAKMDAEMGTMEMTGDPGVDFVMMMIPHHQSAIDMAEAYLESTDQDPELVQLSKEIIEAQKGEIAFLRDWLARNGR